MRKYAMVVPAMTLLALVAGCSGSGSGSGSQANTASSAGKPSGASVAQPERAALGMPAPAPKAAAPATRPADASGALGRDVVRTGALTLRTPDVPGTIARATAAVRAVSGYVAGQQAAIDPNDHRKDNATLMLKVPGSTYDSVLPTLSRLGTVLGSTDQRDDVTGDVIDAASRLATEQASVARVRTLLSRARTVGEVVSVESELTRREASLESLKGRLAALKGQVSYATITMQLSSPTTAPKPPKSKPAGFLGGLQRGWHDFAALTIALLTAAGAALPFVVTLLVFAAGGLAIRRRIVRRPAVATTD